MKCQGFNKATNEPCQEEAENGFPGCSMTHGMRIKDAKGWMNDFRTGDLTLDSFYSGMGPKTWTVGEYLHYLEMA